MKEPFRTVVLSIGEDHKITVQLKQEQRTVKSFDFYNYIGYGDTLTRVSDEWIKYGLLPQQQNGLIEV